MGESKQVSIMKWCVLGLNFIVGIAGAAIMAVSLRLLFDPTFSHVMTQFGIYLAGQILVGAGILMLLVAIIGCIAVLIENPCMLSTFLALLIVFLAAEITGGVLSYTNQSDFEDRISLNIKTTVEKYYGNDVANTTTIDKIQEKWQCCGSYSYTSWSKSVFGVRIVPGSTNQVPNRFLVPKSCCVDQNSDKCEKIEQEGIFNNNLPSKDIIHHEGCSAKLVNVMHNYADYMFGFGAAIILLQIITLGLTAGFICIVRSKNSFRTKRSYYSGSAASQSMLDNAETSKLGASSPSFAGSRSPSLDLAQVQPSVSSLV